MEIASLKHHHMVECENCGKLIIFAGSSEQSIDALDNLLSKHLDRNPPCHEWYDSLPTLKDIRDLACFKEADFTENAEKEQKMDALINTVKDSLTAGPVCDSVMKCPEWEDNMSKIEAAQFVAWNHGAKYIIEPFNFCPWCGKKIIRKKRTWKEKT